MGFYDFQPSGGSGAGFMAQMGANKGGTLPAPSDTFGANLLGWYAPTGVQGTSPDASGWNPDATITPALPNTTVQAGDPQQDGNQSVDFESGTSDWMNGTIATPASVATEAGLFAALVNSESAGAARAIFSFSHSSATNRRFSFVADDVSGTLRPRLRIRDLTQPADGVWTANDLAFTPGSWDYVLWWSDGSNYSVRLNGTASASITNTGDADYVDGWWIADQDADPNMFNISSARHTIDSVFDGLLRHLVVVSGATTLAQRTELETYLADQIP